MRALDPKLSALYYRAQTQAYFLSALREYTDAQRDDLVTQADADEKLDRAHKLATVVLALEALEEKSS